MWPDHNWCPDTNQSVLQIIYVLDWAPDQQTMVVIEGNSYWESLRVLEPKMERFAKCNAPAQIDKKKFF